MNPLVFHIVSGDAFVTGNVLLVLAAASFWWKQSIVNRFSVFAAFIGMLLIVLSAAPFTIVYYALLGLLVIALIWANSHKNSRRVALRLTCAIVLFAGFGVTSDLVARMPVQFDRLVPRHLTIFGDSVTAGMGENEAVTWPNLLASQHQIEIDDRARMGATVGSQLRELDIETIKPGVILIELGGNDIFGATTPEQFHGQLDDLLSRLSLTGQPIVMLELPLPPTFNRFGLSQHELTGKHRIHLVHKQLFASILAGNGATLDSIHLSQQGHDLMAEKIWKTIAGAFESATQ